MRCYKTLLWLFLILTIVCSTACDNSDNDDDTSDDYGLPAEILSVSPADGAIDVSVDSDITVVFDVSMDLPLVANSAAISARSFQPSDNCSGDVLLSKDNFKTCDGIELSIEGNTITVTPQYNFATNERYKIKVLSTLKNGNGETFLSRGYTTPNGFLTVAEAPLIPQKSAEQIEFTDIGGFAGEIDGTIDITEASGDADITEYVIYWGVGPNTRMEKQDPIACIEIPQSASAAASTRIPSSCVEYAYNDDTGVYSYTLPEAISIPPTATYLLVFTKNAAGEMGSGVGVLITDEGVPTENADNIIFTDQNPDGGVLSGMLIIDATDENEDYITHYALYWGFNRNTKLEDAPHIVTIAATGQNLTYTFTNQVIPLGATDLLVFSKYNDAERTTGINIGIPDDGAPVNAAIGASFADTNPEAGHIQGVLTIVRASYEDDVENYAVYWAQEVSGNIAKMTGYDASVILPKTSNDLTYSFGDTEIPVGATHLLILTQDGDGGEMTTGVNASLFSAVEIAFTDSNTNEGYIAGDVTITKATDETYMTDYALYWGSENNEKLADTAAIDTIAKTGDNITYTLQTTIIPDGATHLLVFTVNDGIEDDDVVYVEITDNIIPTQ